MHPYLEIFQKNKLQGNIRIYDEKSKSIEYNPLNDEITVRSDENVNVMITIVRDGKKMVTRIKDSSPNEVESAIIQCLPLLDKVSPDADATPLEITDTIEKDFREFKYADVSHDFFMAQWEKVKNFTCPEGMHIENFSYNIEESETSFFNHLGSQKSQKRSAGSYQVEYFLEREDFSDAEARSRASASLESISDEFLADIQLRLENKSRPSQAKIQSGTMTIVLDSNLVAEFIEFVASALSAESIRQKQSFITMDSLGKSLFGTNFTLKNNPAYPHSAYNTLFDSEGITAEPTTLIENGVVKNLFVDMKNSRKFSLPAKGNSNVSNLVFETDETIENPLKNAHFIFTDLMAFHTVDKMTGKFALEGEGYEIVDGKKGNFVKNIALSSSVLHLFENIESIGNKPYTDANVFVPIMSFKNQKIVV